MKYVLKIAGIHFAALQEHLYPGDGFEAVSVALCSSISSDESTYFFVHKVKHIPYEDCTIRESAFLDWSTQVIQPLLIEADKKNLSVLKIHSHPNGYSAFSETDNNSDLDLFSSVLGWTQEVNCHLSCVMLPDGKVFGRIVNEKLKFLSLSKISIIGDDIVVFNTSKIEKSKIDKELNERNLQTFGDGTASLLAQMKIAVVGCSGTGSIVIEQLARLGVGELIIIDPDRVEKKNLNRIINSTLSDAENKKYKVDLLKSAIASFGFNTKVTAYNKNLYDSKTAIKDIASSDAIFGCVDTVDGRHLINLLSSYYLLPYFDVGVRLDADGKGGINAINGSVHYIQPGRSSMLSRGVYTPEQLTSAGNLRKDPERYKSLLKEKYLKGVEVDSPAVISINMFYSSMAVNDFLARIHPFRIQVNKDCAVQRFVLSDPYYKNESADDIDPYFTKFVGRGDVYPLLGLPELS